MMATMSWAEDMFNQAFAEAKALHAFANSPVGQAMAAVRRGGDDAVEVFISQHETIMDYAKQIRNLKLRVAELEKSCNKSS